jgi:DNA-binding MarR family transcriptional regulator
MELSMKQAAMLAVINSQPGITGPELASLMSDFVPLIQFPQHIARLRNRGLIATERVHRGGITIEVSLTKEGEKHLEEAMSFFQFLSKKRGKKT